VIDSPDPTKEKETKGLFFLYKRRKTIIFFNLSIVQREGNVAKAELPGWDRKEEVCWEWKVSFAFWILIHSSCRRQLFTPFKFNYSPPAASMREGLTRAVLPGWSDWPAGPAQPYKEKSENSWNQSGPGPQPSQPNFFGPNIYFAKHTLLSYFFISSYFILISTQIDIFVYQKISKKNHESFFIYLFMGPSYFIFDDFTIYFICEFLLWNVNLVCNIYLFFFIIYICFALNSFY